jgi:hypothetical protein
VAEHLALEELVGQRGAVDCNVPLSPTSKTVLSVGATLVTISMTRFIAGAAPTVSSNRFCSYSFSAAWLRIDRTAFPTTSAASDGAQVLGR